MKRVLKWNIPADDRDHPIGGGQVLHVACQGDRALVQVWTLETEDDGPYRAVRIFGTGQPVPDHAGPYLGTALAADGALVWHVFGS